MCASYKYESRILRCIIFTVCCLTVLVSKSWAQPDNKLLVLDANSGDPVSSVQLIVYEGTIAYGDYNGKINISQSARTRFEHFIIFSPGYVPDTLYSVSLPDTVFLKPLEAKLREAVVSSKKAELVLKSGIEYVVDYEFAGDKILVVTYSGNNGKDAKLYLLETNGDTFAFANIDVYPEGLFKSCVGMYYLVSYDGFYPILSDSAQPMYLGDKKPLEELKLLKECVLFLGMISITINYLTKRFSMSHSHILS